MTVLVLPWQHLWGDHRPHARPAPDLPAAPAQRQQRRARPQHLDPAADTGSRRRRPAQSAVRRPRLLPVAHRGRGRQRRGARHPHPEPRPATTRRAVGAALPALAALRCGPVALAGGSQRALREAGRHQPAAPADRARPRRRDPAGDPPGAVVPPGARGRARSRPHVAPPETTACPWCGGTPAATLGRLRGTGGLPLHRRRPARAAVRRGGLRAQAPGAQPLLVPPQAPVGPPAAAGARSAVPEAAEAVRGQRLCARPHREGDVPTSLRSAQESRTGIGPPVAVARRRLADTLDCTETRPDRPRFPFR